MKKILIIIATLLPLSLFAGDYVTREVTVTSAGTLQTTYTETYGTNYTINKLTVHGPINGADWKFIRGIFLPNKTVSSNPFEQRIFIDLSDASLVASEDTWITKSGTGKITADNVVPSYFLTRASDTDTHEIGTIALPNSATVISASACENAMALNYIFIGRQTRTIERNAFKGNIYLRGVFTTKDNSISEIGDNAFDANASNANFAVAALPQNLTRVAPQIFLNRTGIKKLYVFSSTVFANAFLSSKPSEVHFISPTTPTFQNKIIQMESTSSKIYVPVGTKSSYISAMGTNVYVTSGSAVPESMISESYLNIPGAHGQYYRTWSDEAGYNRSIPSALSVYTASNYTGNTSSNAATEGTVTLSAVIGAIPATACILKSEPSTYTYTLGSGNEKLMIIAGMENDVHTSGQCDTQKLNEILTAEMISGTFEGDNMKYVLAPVTAESPIMAPTNYLVGSASGTVGVEPVIKDGETVTYRNFYLNWYNMSTSADDEESTLGFYRASSSSMGAHKAYLSLPASVVGNIGGAGNNTSGKAKQIGIEFADEPTSITMIENAGFTAHDDAYYTLQGIRVVKPIKGIYIHKGRKKIIK